jgi:prepilin-type N-terminal cleavage/methylation domain-containing protein
MNKKKNGFTLIELLVTIALMLSILGIAIISLVSASNRKKEEAWTSVKEQIETAAVEYLSSNEYLFEGLSDETTASIPLQTLVELDYINKVTDPRTGKALNECNYVEVTKSKHKYNATYKDSDDKSCTTGSVLKITEPGAPTLNVDVTELSIKKLISNTVWYKDGAKFDASTDRGASITSCYTTSNSDCDPQNDNSSLELDYTGKSKISQIRACFKATNSSSKSTKECVSINVDNTAPTCAVSSNPNIWTNKDVTITGKCSDSESGCSSSKVITTIKTEGKKSYSPGTVTDNLGHSTTCGTKTVYIDKTAPKISLIRNNGSVAIKGEATDSLSGVASYSWDSKSWTPYTKAVSKNDVPTYGKQNTHSFYVKDNAGNVASKDIRGYKTCENTTVYTSGDDIAKAYKWSNNTNECKKDNKITMTSTEGKTTTITGPYRRYEFAEYECYCKVDSYYKSKGKKYNCGYSGMKNITKDTHVPNSDGKYYSYIIYKNSSDGLDSCNNKNKVTVNTNVQRICINGKVSGKTEYHGWYWYSYDPSAKERDANDTKDFGWGWYINGSDKEKIDVNTSVNNVCAKACASKYK